jgi:hypothetical protein
VKNLFAAGEFRKSGEWKLDWDLEFVERGKVLKGGLELDCLIGQKRRCRNLRDGSSHS